MTFERKYRGAPPSRFVADHRCTNPKCGVTFELMLDNEAEHDLPWVCSECGSLAPRTLGVLAPPVTIVRGNSDFGPRQRERLYDRSTAHFKKEGRDEAIERQRAQFKREGLVP
jgi:hypothetical protein